MATIDRDKLEEIYFKFNKKNFVHPDPLEFLYRYRDIKDREIAGMIASSLAYGKVSQILKSVEIVLNALGTHPADFLLNNDNSVFTELFNHFKHRFTTGREISLLLAGIKKILTEYGTLHNCFMTGCRPEGDNILQSMTSFIGKLRNYSGLDNEILIPDPGRGSACKRLNLFLRWLVRTDDVDPGGWNDVPKSMLIIPLDTHMHRFGIEFGFTERKSGDIKTAIEITDHFKKINPADPVKYDFSITRYGIRDDFLWENLSRGD